ncbi:hypothetical protein [Pelagicoccus sp. SDUM812005]|uniref:hypothetical protein n=1 Tax=Pelagicoccus sp. SDUM812005 TaxID=3041257 RepID=UPI00280EA4EF|nr:hypothetical protein [Pelagicoccus sp. SDUM812005]MDQ8182620.1 hypothetical protein [Pelagicoccus sp. SDUM812005]
MPDKLRALLAILSLYLLASPFAAHGNGSSEEDEDMLVIELSGFEVFSKGIKLIDGMTGKDYEGDHPVVLGFRREFDDILLKFHKRLVIGEFRNIRARKESIRPHIEKLAALAASFGWEGFQVGGPHLTREVAIFERMLKDPFFKIEEIVVWDARRLAEHDNIPPKNKYAKNIRFNEETGKWERRILTKWEVSYIRNNHRTGKSSNFYTYKEQGLNLDTNRGFHLIDVGLPGDVQPRAFKEVGLEYPIVIDYAVSIEDEINELKRDLVENLIYLYDPFSWVARGNTRFRGGFRKQLQAHIRQQQIPLDDRNWFDPLFAQFLDDVVSIQIWGANEIYEHRILSSIPKNRNQLGEDLDLLNWHKREKRSVDYNPEQRIKAPATHFGSVGSTRFIMIDAYRRYGEKFLDALRTRILALEEKADPRQLVLDAIEAASGIPADKYLPAAAKAQKAELERFVPKS